MNNVTQLVLFLFLSGCALFLPGTVLGESKAEIPAAAPQSDTGAIVKALTLEECMSYLMQNNPDIAASKWSVEAARARVDVATRTRLPTLTADGSYQYYEDPQRLVQARYNGELGVFDKELYRGDLVIRLPLFTGGRITNEIDAQRLLLEATRERSTATRDQLVFTTKNVFYSIMAQKDLIDSLQFSKNALERQQKIIEQLILLKKAARIDLLRIEVRIANLVQSIVKEQNTLSVLKCTLANLLGWQGKCGFDLQGSLALVEEEHDRAALLQKALAQRPDYKALKAEAQSQEKRVAIATSDYFPSLSFMGSYGRRINGPGNEENVGFSGIVASMPIFDLRTPAKVRDETSKERVLKEQLRKLELQICRDVETSLLDITSSVERVKANRKAIEQANESLRIEQQKYNYGKGSMTDVLDAQAALLQAQTNYYRALAEFQISRAKLEFSTGGTL